MVQMGQDAVAGTKGFRRLAAIVLLVAFIQSCGSGSICNCDPTQPASMDFRHAEKHIALPGVTPVETTVAQMLTWPVGPTPSTTAPRSGRELTLYHIAQAFLQNARLVSQDCDVHLELSDGPAKNAPRVIVETPIDSEYCSARQNLESQLASHGFKLQAAPADQSELSQPLPVSALGLAFQDFEHDRGSPQVVTPWELHPAIVNALP